jgi:hypothetical protein
VFDSRALFHTVTPHKLLFSSDFIPEVRGFGSLVESNIFIFI